MKRDDESVLYKFKGIIFIPPLQMAGDVLMISRCGIETIEANSILNYKMESKKLRLSKDKCYHMYISKNGSKCPSELKVHNFPMEKVDSALYLGDLITASGSVDETIKARELKAIGIRSQIMSILKNVSLGMFYFQTAFILRESMFKNGIMTNIEAWNFIPEKGYKVLEDADIRIFSDIFGCYSNRVSYYLESAKLPLRYSISKRRFMYLWHLLTRNKKELISKVYHIQKIQQFKNDYFSLIFKGEEKYRIT